MQVATVGDDTPLIKELDHRSPHQEEDEKEISPGYMGWQMDEEETLSKDKTFLAFQKIVNGLRSDVKHLEEKVSDLEKTSNTQNNKIGKLDKKYSSLIE